jgi:DNA-binding LacI/PurR family transcriptional regulator
LELKMAKRHKIDTRPTIAQIATAAGVSIPTVSKVLNGRMDVSPATRERIEKVIEEYGFVRNRAARALGQGKTGLVDLAVPRLDDDYFFPIMQGAEQALKETGVRLVLTSTHYEADEELQWIETVTDRSTDGVLLVLPSDEAIQRLAQQSFPFVVIHNQGGLPSTIPSVTITSWDGGFAATNHLISLGHRRIAYIGKNVSAMDAIERFAGYRTALEVASLPLDPALQCEGQFTADDGYAATMSLMSLESPPTAIFAGNDHHAIGVYRALYELGIAIPRQVSVVGFDNLAYTELMNPALTTIHVPRMEMGREAVTMLLKLIAGEPLDLPRMTLPTHLLERESCAPLK